MLAVWAQQRVAAAQQAAQQQQELAAMQGAAGGGPGQQTLPTPGGVEIVPEPVRQALEEQRQIQAAIEQEQLGGYSVTTRSVQQELVQQQATGGPRQAGGPVSEAASYLVGERGPELFVPHDNGDSTAAVAAAARDMSPSMSIGDTHVQNHFDISVASGTGADLQAMQQAIVDAATRGTLQALRRGNSYTPMRVPSSLAAGRGL